MSDKTSDSSANYLLLTRLADEFAARYRNGERPALQEYIDRHPGLADDIREMFPAMVEIEQAGEDHLEAEQAAAPASPALRQLGDFRIIREVGKGGMGIVYEAEQVSLGRHVALKLLPKTMLLDAKAKRRFEREAKSAAKLHHTNIVPVFGVGEQDGLPYYVMQFIQGLGLDAVLDELKKLQLGNTKTGTFLEGELRVSRNVGHVSNVPEEERPVKNQSNVEMSAVNVARSLITGQFNGPVNEGNEETASKPGHLVEGKDHSAEAPRALALSDSFALSSSSVVLPGRSRDGSKSKNRKQTFWQSVASIGVQVAEALEYAHKQGINHRDIKPSNLLLDTQGTVWVTDFGLAKADDQQNLTHTGDILGTLRYMPPEAFEGKTDARSDVYSLGLTLYEMLAFQPAFGEKERNRLIKQVTHEEPVRLGKQNRQVPQDLETIVQKAIDRDPNQRYASAGALAEDLQRFIEDEPIKARRVSAVERLRRWCRHNPLLAATTGLAAAALLAVTLVSSYLAIVQANFAAREVRSNDDLRQEQERTEAALKKSTLLGVELDSKLRELRKNSALAAVERGQSLIDQGQVRRGLLWLTRGLELAPADDGDLQQIIRMNLASLRGELPIPLATFAHPHIIRDLAYSPDGRTVAIEGSATTKGEARFYDAATGAQVGPPLPHQGPIFAMAFSPDSKTLMTGDSTAAGAHAGLRFWDIATGKESGPPFDLQGIVTAGAFSSDGKLLATVIWSGTSYHTRLWEITTRQPIGRPIKHGLALSYAMAISPDNKILAIVFRRNGGSGECRLWDVATGKQRGDPLPEPTGIIAVAFSPDSKTLATAGGQDLKTRLWDIASGKMKGMPLEHESQVNFVTFSPDARLLLTACGGCVVLWGAKTGQPVCEPLTNSERVLPILFSPDGQSILITGDDKTARLWSLPLDRQIAPPLPQRARASDLALSGDGKQMLIRSGNTGMGELRLWNTVLDKPSGPALAHQGWYYAAALSPDGKTILTGTAPVVGVPGSASHDAHAARLWSGITGKPIGEPLRCSGQVFAVAFSPDGKRILVGGGDDGQKGEVRLADAASGKALGPPLVLPKPVWAVAFSPDGKTFLTGNGDYVGGQSGELRLWDAGTRAPIGTPFRHRGRVSALAFSQDGTSFASGSRDRTARLWDAATGKPIGLPLAHRGEVNAIAFSPDGMIVATASDDKWVRFWSAKSGRPIGRPLVHHGPVNSVAFTPDGTTLITASDDKNIRFWRVPAPLAGAVEQVEAWAELTSGMVLSPDGATSELE
ncbi:MAG TPA: protein kinase, partial [Gemmataceae bacterium]|nr:protein kinase [Gemmataceae bacterium]